MNEKVSVIIPVYKVEPYIRRCVESILAQTYQNLEIILVDDGSPDNCPMICDEYARLDKRIKVIHKTNGGLSDARNAGLKIFTGDYVYFFDSDDYIANNLIETALDTAIKSSSDLVIFNYYRVDEYDNLLSTSNFDIGTYEIDDNNRVDYIVNKLAKYTLGWEAWNRLYKADIIRDNDLFFWDNRIIFAEDFGFSLNYALHANKITCISDALYYYLIRENSIMSQAAKEPRLSAAMELSKLMEDKITSVFKDSILEKEYPLIFYSIMYEQLRGVNKENYKKTIASIDDKGHFYKNIGRVIRRPILLLKHYGMLRGSVVWLICILLKTRSFSNLNIRILQSYKKRWKIAEVFEINRPKMSSKKRIFLIGSEDFNNLKHHHTAISEREYLENTFPEYSVIEITASEYKAFRRILSFIIKRKDLIYISGGRNLRGENTHTDYIRRDMKKKYRRNRKVIFSQNVPDPILYSNYKERLAFDREGAMLLIHKDMEGALSLQDKEHIEDILGKYTNKIRYNDTILNSDISVFDRKEVVDSFIQKIGGVEFVVTDHLNGMLFSVITHTPCILLPRYKERIEEVYEWISDLGIIKIIGSIEELDEGLSELAKIKKIEYDNKSLIQ